MLLHWGTLEPQGRSRLASVRFSGPVRIRSIRIHPHGASLFAQNPEAVSETEPDAFSLSVFLTAQSSPALHDLKPKGKGTNVLVPTTLAYSGGLREFHLDMGPDFVTRLMVVQGDFRRMTLAVYGDVITNPAATPLAYEPLPLPDVPFYRLPTALDLCNAADPSFLARELLALNSDAPSLPVAIRLMCCVGDEHSDSTTFSNMADSVKPDTAGLGWLTKAMDMLTVPPSQCIDTVELKQYVDKALEETSVKTNEFLYMIAELLRNASAQHGPIAFTILNALDLSDVLDINLLDKHILSRLQDAAASSVVARALRSTRVSNALQILRDSASTNHPTKDAVGNLLQRIHYWERFEKALSAPTSDIAAVTRWIREITSNDVTFGIFVSSLTEDDILVSKLSGHASQELAGPIVTWTSASLISPPEFISFVRALVGISCVIVVLCWSVHVSDARCTERIFAMVRLWQEVDGYREIVNHLLLIPRLTYHMESLLKSSESSSPSTTLIHVEQILARLLAHPETMVQPELVVLVNALGDSPASISEDERLEMVEISMIVSGGLSEAVNTVLTWSNRPVDTTRVRTLQTALSLVEMALEDRDMGEWRVMQAAWKEGSHGLVYCLVERLHSFVASIRSQFLLTPPPPLHPQVLLRSLVCSSAILRILSRLLPAYPLPTRMIRVLTRDTSSLFIATDAVDSRYSRGSSVCQAARVTRPTCADAIAVLSATQDESEADRVGGQVVLQTLLHSALHPEGDDPVTRLEQVFWLLDLVLPLSLSDTSGDRAEQRFWVRKVIPNVLLELQRFIRALAVDHQVQLVKRLIDLDRGEVALGEWFVNEELNNLILIMEDMKNSPPELDKDSIFQARLSNSFQLLSGLVEATSSVGSLELFHDTQTLDKTARVLACALDSGTIVSSLLDFTCLLVPHASLMTQKVQLELALTLIRGAGSRPSALLAAATILPLIHQAPVQMTEVTRVASELGPSLQCSTEEVWQSYWRLDKEKLAQGIIFFLDWLVRQSKGETVLLPGISEASFTHLLERVATAAPGNENLLAGARTSFIFSDDLDMRPVVESRTLVLSMNRLRELLKASPVIPSTPRLSGESVFKMATLSPITALMGTSKISTLTKTYQNNDFRQLSVRQNTSRRPSMHVDDFEQSGADLASPVAVHPSPPAPLITADYFQMLPQSKAETE